MKRKEIECVSFDVFGTLIKRTVSTRDMFSLMEQVMAKEKIAEINDFAECRKKAEQIARKKYGNNYNLKEIYQVFVPELSSKQIKNLMELEERFEIANSVVNPCGMELYKQYKNDYKIIVISDMYLRSEVIKEILNRNGYNIKTIFVSSDYRKSKREGNLYQKVLEELNVSGGKILHIGDAVRSDFVNARIFGMKSMLIDNKESYYYDWGCKILGPIIYNFCRWINENVRQGGELLFVTREGDILKRFYDALYNEKESDLIYLSRRAILSCICGVLLKKHTMSQIIEKISLNRNETIEGFLTRLGLDFRKYETLLVQNNIDRNTLLVDVDIDAFFDNNREMLFDDLDSNADFFKKYLDDKLKRENVLVDIGWKGSMQNLLSDYLDLIKCSKKIRGLYLGSMGGKDMNGFLFNENNAECQKVLNYSGLLEVVLMPEYGSVLGYKEEGDNIIPQLDKSELSRESTKIINEVQQGVMNFLCRMDEFGDGLTFDSREAEFLLNKFGNRPTLKDIRMFGNLDFYDNGEKKYLVNVDKNNLKKAFLECKWKTAFLKRMLKIILPYDKIVISLRKIKDRNV